MNKYKRAADGLRDLQHHFPKLAQTAIPLLDLAAQLPDGVAESVLKAYASGELVERPQPCQHKNIIYRRYTPDTCRDCGKGIPE